ncbi:hypothetical protein ACTUVN_002642 [Pseudomonas caspiana]
MSESKFTPGPWEAIENGFTKMAVISGEGHYLTYAAGNDRMTDQVLEANAKLIAAAPDMIAALELIAGLHDHEKPSFELAQAMYEAACIARSAIQKATA